MLLLLLSRDRASKRKMLYCPAISGGKVKIHTKATWSALICFLTCVTASFFLAACQSSNKNMSDTFLSEDAAMVYNKFVKSYVVEFHGEKYYLVRNAAFHRAITESAKASYPLGVVEHIQKTYFVSSDMSVEYLDAFSDMYIVMLKYYPKCKKNERLSQDSRNEMKSKIDRLEMLHLKIIKDRKDIPESGIKAYYELFKDVFENCK